MQVVVQWNQKGDDGNGENLNRENGNREERIKTGNHRGEEIGMIEKEMDADIDIVDINEGIGVGIEGHGEGTAGEIDRVEEPMAIQCLIDHALRLRR